MRGSTSQWSFSDMASQLVSFKSTQERGGNHSSYPPHFPQRSLPSDKHVTTHHWQQNDIPSIHHGFDGRVLSGTGHTGQSMYLPGNTSNQVPLSKAGASTIATVTISHGNGPVVGSTDLRSSPSISTGPCQLTIFYNGSVCVYDHVSPEKAQAIMLLAGNGDSTKPNTATIVMSSTPKLQPPVSKMPQNDPAIVTRSPVPKTSAVNTAIPNHPLVKRLPTNNTCTANQGPALRAQGNDTAITNEPPSTNFLVKADTSVSNQSGRFSGSAPVSTSITQSLVVSSTSWSEVISAKPFVASVLAKCPDPLKANSFIGAGGAKSAPSAVPQARKASLARFLEKRKERVIDASPYPMTKNSEYNSIGVDSTFATDFVISKQQFDSPESRT